MRSVNSVSKAKSHEDPSTNQRDVDESSKTLIEHQKRGEESSKTLSEDLNEPKAEERDEEEFRLRRYIKKGECNDAFIAFQKCKDEAEKNEEESDVMKCKEVRVKFKTCMSENPIYYEPIIVGEARAIANMFLRKLEVEKEAILAGDVATIARVVSRWQSENAEPVMPALAPVIAKAFQVLEAKKDKDKFQELEAKMDKDEG